MKAGFLGLGTFIPRNRITNKDLEKKKELDTSDEWIYPRTGIKSRPIIAKTGNNTTLSDIGAKAAKIAINNADIDKKEIDMIICASGSLENKPWPSTACLIQQKLKIENNCPAYDIEAACTSFVYGLKEASAYIESRQCKNILLVSPETMTKQVDWNDRNTCILFGDAAGAVVLSTEKQPFHGILNSVTYANGKGADLLKIPNNGENSFIKMDGKEVFKFAVKKGISAIKEVLKLEGASIDLEKIKYIIPHQANQRITEGIRKNLDIPKEKMISFVENLGNTGASSIPIVLYKLYKDSKIQKGDYIITVAFGAGLTWGANLIRWNLLRKMKGDDLVG